MKRQNINKCRRLRKSQTDAEKKLWRILRNRQLNNVKFRRQFPIGSYILDFYSPEYKLAVEADGGQHYSEEGLQKDKMREEVLRELGVEMIRFSNIEILANIDGVHEVIDRTIRKRPPHLNPLPSGRGSEK
jgi:very-short-patch-repair endonuclease